MPRVPQYTPRESLAPLPNARRSASVTADALGADTSREQARTHAVAAASLGQVTDAALGIYGRQEAERRRAKDEWEDRANRVAITRAETALGEWELTASQEAFALKGQAALGVPEQVMSGYRKRADEIANGLNPIQREQFDLIRGKRALNLQGKLHEHVYTEIKAYEASEYQASISNALSSAAHYAKDPRRAGLELDRAVTSTTDLLKSQGAGYEAIDAAVLKTLTIGHSAIIDQLLKSDQPAKAKAWFDKVKDHEISGDALDNIEQKIEQGSRLKESQTATDKILAEGGTYSQQLEKAKDIEDAEVRKLVEGMIDHERGRRDAIERDIRETNLQTVVNAIDAKSGPPSMASLMKMPEWHGLTVGERSGMLNYLQNRAQGIPVKTDVKEWYRLMRMAADEPEKFAKESLLAYKSRLDEGDFKSLASMQVSISGKASTAANRDLFTFRTVNQIIDSSLRTYGVNDDDKKDKEAVKHTADLTANVSRLTAQWVQDYQTGPNGAQRDRPTDLEIQAFVDKLVAPSFEYVARTGWFGGETKAQGRLGDLKIEHVPAGARQAIVDDLKAKGFPGTVPDEIILRAYVFRRAAGR